MQPTLRTGDIVVGWKQPLRVGAVVAARQGDRLIIKRVERIDGDRVYLVGDNRDESTDSRHYGNLDRSAILGTVMIVLPKATQPPRPVRPAAVMLGRAAALILVAMALIHLFRIDTLIPILDQALPGGKVAASLVTLLIILSEVFAIPFALRMKLSPLAQIKSGALLAFAPLWWLLISIWALDFSPNIGELGEFIAVPGTWAVVIVNMIWVIFSYVTLYMLGYSQLTLKKLLKK